MSIKFAEQILDSMVDENGHCGERGISKKQFDILSRYLYGTEAKKCGGWTGDFGGGVEFWENDHFGTIGKYNVKLHLYKHFNFQCSVVSIDRWIDEVPTFENSKHMFSEKERVELELTLVREGGYEIASYRGYGKDYVNVYTMADAEGNCFVWKTTNALKSEVEGEEYENAWGETCCDIDTVYAEPGDRIKMKATVKAHDEYRGIKQNVLTRCKVSEIAKR